jgi:hypothetical protein
MTKCIFVPCKHAVLYRGEGKKKKKKKKIQDSHHSQGDQILIYCRGASPNPSQTCLEWTGATVVYRQAVEIGSHATIVSMNVSHRDVAFHALLDATKLTKDLLTNSLTNAVVIYTADQQIILWCLTTDRHDNVPLCKAICKQITTILFDHPNLTISIRWIPGTASFLLLKHIVEVTSTAAANIGPAAQHTLPIMAALKQAAKLNALKEWEHSWLTDPHQGPAYWALHHPPSGQPLEFIARIEGFAQPIFCTAIQLLTEHAFTGEYNARHHPQAPDPHDCQCRLTLLQTADHIITQCPIFKDPWETFL